MLRFEVVKFELVNLSISRAESIDLRKDDHTVFDGVDAEFQDGLVYGALPIDHYLTVIRIKDLDTAYLLPVDFSGGSLLVTTIEQEEERGIIELLKEVARANGTHFHIFASGSFLLIGHDARVYSLTVLHENYQDQVQIDELFVRGASDMDLFEGLVSDLRDVVFEQGLADMVNALNVGILLSGVSFIQIKLEKLVFRPKGRHDKQVVCISRVSVTYFHVVTIGSQLNLMNL